MKPKKHRKHWTEEEIAYLEERWGTVSVRRLAENLGRTESSIRAKAISEGLGNYLEASGMVSVLSFFNLFFPQGGCYYGRRRKLFETIPTKNRININGAKHRMVDLDLFWPWAEKHKEEFPWYKLEPLILGKEPEWVDEMRKSQYREISQSHKAWNSFDDARLRELILKKHLRAVDAAKEMKRSTNSVRKRAYDLGLNYKTNSDANWWSEEDTNKLLQLGAGGSAWEDIAEQLKRSVKSCKYKFYQSGGSRKRGRRDVGRKSGSKTVHA